MRCQRKKLRYGSDRRQTLQAGLTLAEMVVVVAIVALVATVLIFNYSSFSTNVSVRNLAQETALAIRKAQTYATSVRSLGGGSADSLTYPAYGISFSLNAPGNDKTAPSTKRFTIFADTDSNELYSTNGQCSTIQDGSAECIESLGITTADKIVGLKTDQGTLSSGTVNVIFTRPAPDATICVVSGTNCTVVSSLDVTIQSAKGITRTVEVWNTGQISVK